MRKTLVALGAAVLGASGGLAAPKSGSVSLGVRIGPAAEITFPGELGALLRIRLHAGAQASLWRATVCGAPGPEVHTIGASGIYTLALTGIPGLGEKLCLRSTDGTLLKEWIIPVSR